MKRTSHKYFLIADPIGCARRCAENGNQAIAFEAKQGFCQCLGTRPSCEAPAPLCPSGRNQLACGENPGECILNVFDTEILLAAAPPAG